MHELTIISGKGGTGKTTITSSFAVLANNHVLADADVDAANLHVLFRPQTLHAEPFSGGYHAEIISAHCNGCGKCREICRFHAISASNGQFTIDDLHCEGCGICYHVCPENAIDLAPASTGDVITAQARCGPMVYAELNIAEENSGKLVTQVRAQAQKLAKQHDCDTILIDGPPGLGCPVIASLTGVNLVLIVAEPTPSSMHDMQRVIELATHFNIETCICVNKWDLNQSMTADIEKCAEQHGVQLAGRVRYDQAVTDAQVNGKAIVEYTDNEAAQDVRRVWEYVSQRLR